MDPNIASKLATLPSASESLAGWRLLLGVDFDEVRPHLLRCHGKRVGGYPNPEGDGWLTVRESGDGYVAFASGDEAEDFEDVRLTWEEVQSWRVDREWLESIVKPKEDLSMANEQYWVPMRDWEWCTAVYPQVPGELTLKPGDERLYGDFIRRLRGDMLVASRKYRHIPEGLRASGELVDMIGRTVRCRDAWLPRVRSRNRTVIGMGFQKCPLGERLEAEGFEVLGKAVRINQGCLNRAWDKWVWYFFLSPLLRLAAEEPGGRDALMAVILEELPERLEAMARGYARATGYRAGLWLACGFWVEMGRKGVAETLWGGDLRSVNPGGVHLVEKVRERIESLNEEGCGNLLGAAPFEPVEIQWNGKPFLVELPPECYRAYALQHVSIDDYHPGLADGTMIYEDLDQEKIKYGCLLSLIGREITLEIQILMKKPKALLPGEVHTTGDILKYHEGGALRVDGQAVAIYGCRVLETEPKHVAMIDAYRRVRGGGAGGVPKNPEISALVSAKTPTKKTKKRSQRATNIDGVKRLLKQHIISARDHAYKTQERKGTPELLPRPTQDFFADALKVHVSSISRAINDPHDNTAKVLWEIANDVDQVMRYKGR